MTLVRLALPDQVRLRLSGLGLGHTLVYGVAFHSDRPVSAVLILEPRDGHFDVVLPVDKILHSVKATIVLRI